MADLAGIQDRLTIAVLEGIWKDQRVSIDGNIEYRGVNIVHDAPTSDDTWEIWRITKDENGNKLRTEGPLQGSWDNKESLSWDALAIYRYSQLDIATMFSKITGTLESMDLLLRKIEYHLMLITKHNLTDKEL